jgi:hypothetical protein
MPKNQSRGWPIMRVAPMAGRKPNSQSGKRMRSRREFMMWWVEWWAKLGGFNWLSWKRAALCG